MGLQKQAFLSSILVSFGSKLSVTGYSRGTKSGIAKASGKPWHMILVADGVAEKAFMIDEQVARSFPVTGTVLNVTADHTERDGKTFLNNPKIRLFDANVPVAEPARRAA